jgi:hypothetical protein
MIRYGIAHDRKSEWYADGFINTDSPYIEKIFFLQD